MVWLILLVAICVSLFLAWFFESPFRLKKEQNDFNKVLKDIAKSMVDSEVKQK